jgi:hypothetical protein
MHRRRVRQGWARRTPRSRTRAGPRRAARPTSATRPMSAWMKALGWCAASISPRPRSTTASTGGSGLQCRQAALWPGAGALCLAGPKCCTRHCRPPGLQPASRHLAGRPVRGGVHPVLRPASRFACRDRQRWPCGSRKCAASRASLATPAFRRRIPWGEGARRAGGSPSARRADEGAFIFYVGTAPSPAS